jgi:hypothetical protein
MIETIMIGQNEGVPKKNDSIKKQKQRRNAKTKKKLLMSE